MATIEAIDKDDTNWYCPHCEERVSKATYYRHRRKFFNHLDNTWELPAGTTPLISLTVAEPEYYSSQEPQGHISDILRKYSYVPGAADFVTK